MFIDSDEKVYACGKGDYGQLGLNSTADHTTPQEITYFTTNNISIVQVFCGESHSMALDDSGNLYGWGRNDKGQLGLGHTNQVLVPTALDMDDFSGNVTKVDLGGLHSLVITDEGKSYTFGDNSKGQLGIGNTTDQSTPQLVNSNTINGAAGGLHTLLLTPNTSGPTDGNGVYTENDILGAGDNRCGQLGPPMSLGTLGNNPLSSNTITTLSPMPKPLDGSGNKLNPINVSALGRGTAMIVPQHGVKRDYVVINNDDKFCDTAGDQLDNCCDSAGGVPADELTLKPVMPLLDSEGQTEDIIICGPFDDDETSSEDKIVVTRGTTKIFDNSSSNQKDLITPPPANDENPPTDGGGGSSRPAGSSSASGSGGC